MVYYCKKIHTNKENSERGKKHKERRGYKGDVVVVVVVSLGGNERDALAD